MVRGASYTDVNARLPALTFLTIVAVICAILFFVNAGTASGASRSSLWASS